MIDDDADFSRLVESALQELGAKSVAVRSGEEGLKLCRNAGPPLAVVLDGLLPGMRGDEVARRLRQTWPGDALPIAFVSAFFRDMKSYAYLTAECGVSMVLHKPISRDELRRALGRLPPLRGLSDLPEEFDVDVELTDPSGEIVFPRPDVAELLSEYLAVSQERTQAMRAALSEVGGPGGPEALAMLQAESHRLRGSGASFGIPEISRLAGEIEDLLRGAAGQGLPKNALARLTGLVEALAEKVRRTAGGAPIAVAADDAEVAIKVVVLDASTELASSCGIAEASGQPVRVFHEASDAVNGAIQLVPDVILVAGDRPELDGVAACKRFRAAGLGPIMLMSRSESIADRLRAVKGGIDGYISRPADAEAVFRLAQEYVRPVRGTKILAMDEDRQTLSSIAEALAPHKIDVEPCPDPADLFAALERSRPNLLVFCPELSGVSGLEVLRAIRADYVYRAVPVLVVSRVGKVDARVEALEAGADDYLQKPFAPSELAARVLVHLAQRARAERESLREPVTGAFRPRYFRAECERALALARRAGRTLAVLVMDCDVSTIRAEHGRFAADEVMASLAARLRSSFRTSDVVARTGSNRLAVLLYDVAETDAARLLNGELEAFRARTFLGAGGRPFGALVRGAMAVFPDVAGGPEALLRAAEERL